MSSCIDAADRQRYAGQIKRLGGQVASDSDPHFTHFLTLSGGALCRLAALDAALAAAKGDFAAGGDASAFMAFKAERDLLRRAVETGSIWSEDS